MGTLITIKLCLLCTSRLVDFDWLIMNANRRNRFQALVECCISERKIDFNFFKEVFFVCVESEVEVAAERTTPAFEGPEHGGRGQGDDRPLQDGPRGTDCQREAFTGQCCAWICRNISNKVVSWLSLFHNASLISVANVCSCLLQNFVIHCEAGKVMMTPRFPDSAIEQWINRAQAAGVGPKIYGGS
jgi:hypothetical protein